MPVAIAVAILAVPLVAIVPGPAPAEGLPSGPAGAEASRPVDRIGVDDHRPAAGLTRDHLVIARGFLGTNPTGRRSLWCADFMNLVEARAGRKGTGSRLARSYLEYGAPVRRPVPGDIVVLRRGRDARSGHVGYLLAEEAGHVRLISGNYRGAVGVGRYPKSRVLGYRRPR